MNKVPELTVAVTGHPMQRLADAVSTFIASASGAVIREPLRVEIQRDGEFLAEIFRPGWMGEVLSRV